jgi:hypothetical protein
VLKEITKLEAQIKTKASALHVDGRSLAQEGELHRERPRFIQVQETHRHLTTRLASASAEVAPLQQVNFHQVLHVNDIVRNTKSIKKKCSSWRKS